MVTAVREFSLEHYMLDRLRHCATERENLADPISIIASLKNNTEFSRSRSQRRARRVRPRPSRVTRSKPRC